MKKLAFIGIMILGLAVGFTSNLPELLQKGVQKISQMNEKDFNEFINKRHYLVKDWALDPKKTDPKTYKALYETLNFQTTALNYFKKIVGK